MVFVAVISRAFFISVTDKYCNGKQKIKLASNNRGGLYRRFCIRDPR